MKSLQEKKIENELNSLKKNSNIIPVEIRKVHKDEYYITVTLPLSLFESSNYHLKSDLHFLMLLPQNYPFNAPRLYCLTPFSTPNICDGRDILEDVINEPWDNQLLLVEIVNSLPKFVTRYLENLSKGVISKCGKFYLDEKYELDILNQLPVCIRKVEEVVIKNGNKETKEGKYLVISDTFFLLFNFEFLNKNNLTLTFYANIKALTSMKEFVGEDVAEFNWKARGGKTTVMRLGTEEGGEIVKLLMDNLKKYGIEYSVSKKTLGPKEGTLPEIDIEMVEKQIKDIEKKILHDDTPELIMMLMDYYEKGVRYYSAINDNRYEDLMVKIKSIMANEKYSAIFDKKREEDEKKEKQNQEAKRKEQEQKAKKLKEEQELKDKEEKEKREKEEKEQKEQEEKNKKEKEEKEQKEQEEKNKKEQEEKEQEEKDKREKEEQESKKKEEKEKQEKEEEKKEEEKKEEEKKEEEKKEEEEKEEEEKEGSEKEEKKGEEKEVEKKEEEKVPEEAEEKKEEGKVGEEKEEKKEEEKVPEEKEEKKEEKPKGGVQNKEINFDVDDDDDDE